MKGDIRLIFLLVLLIIFVLTIPEVIPISLCSVSANHGALLLTSIIIILMRNVCQVVKHMECLCDLLGVGIGGLTDPPKSDRIRA